jgi:hypothetical protein
MPPAESNLRATGLLSGDPRIGRAVAGGWQKVSCQSVLLSSEAELSAVRKLNPFGTCD